VKRDGTVLSNDDTKNNYDLYRVRFSDFQQLAVFAIDASSLEEEGVKKVK